MSNPLLIKSRPLPLAEMKGKWVSYMYPHMTPHYVSEVSEHSATFWTQKYGEWSSQQINVTRDVWVEREAPEDEENLYMKVYGTCDGI